MEGLKADSGCAGLILGKDHWKLGRGGVGDMLEVRL
jgi:hypothetical protein